MISQVLLVLNLSLLKQIYNLHKFILRHHIKQFLDLSKFQHRARSFQFGLMQIIVDLRMQYAVYHWHTIVRSVLLHNADIDRGLLAILLSPDYLILPSFAESRSYHIFNISLDRFLGAGQVVETTQMNPLLNFCQ